MPVTNYMNLSLPSPSVTIGPAWATQLNTALGLVDSHTHVNGQGQQVPSDGININADLSFNTHGLTSVTRVALTVLTADPSEVRAVYVKGVDLYFEDGNGTPIRMTASGSIAGTNGSIAGLVSPASITYSSVTKTLTMLQDSNKYMIVSCGRVVIHDNTTQLANLAGISILSPLTTTSGAYSITLPSAVPGSTLPVQMSSSGVLSTGVITRSQQAAVGLATTAVTSYTNSTTSLTAIGSILNFVSTGRPIVIMATPTPGLNVGTILMSRNAANAAAIIGINVSGGAVASLNGLQLASTSTGSSSVIASFPMSIFYTIYSPPAGTYTFEFDARCVHGTSGETLDIENITFCAYEL